jgi:hypothetical protein
MTFRSFPRVGCELTINTLDVGSHQTDSICYTISFLRSLPEVGLYSSLAHHDTTVDNTPISEAPTKVAHTFANKVQAFTGHLQDIVDFPRYIPDLPGLIHRFLFLRHPLIFQCNTLISTDPKKQCFICIKPFQSPNLPKPGASLARKLKPCDHVIIDERHGCWVCTRNSFPASLSQKSVVPKDAPGERQAIRPRPCNHFVGDACFERRTSDHSKVDAGRCPYCQQHLTRFPLSITYKV